MEAADPINWPWWYPLFVVLGAVCAMCLGVLGYVRHENRRYYRATIALGLTAAVIQFTLMALLAWLPGILGG